MNRTAEHLLPQPPSRYLTTAEASTYLRFRSPSGVRNAVKRGELRPAGRGPRGVHLFTRAELDRFVAARRALCLRFLWDARNRK